MTLKRISELAGQNIDGLKADIRSRTSDGKLMHEHLEADLPLIVTMKSVSYKTKDRHRWMYWTWHKKTSPIAFDCGYSGVWAEDDKHHDWHILIETMEETR
jgi:hypothetical protein